MNRRSLFRLLPSAALGAVAAPTQPAQVACSVSEERLAWLIDTATQQDWDEGYKDCAAALRELAEHRVRRGGL